MSPRGTFQLLRRYTAVDGEPAVAFRNLSWDTAVNLSFSFRTPSTSLGSSNPNIKIIGFSDHMLLPDGVSLVCDHESKVRSWKVAH